MVYGQSGGHHLGYRYLSIPGHRLFFDPAHGQNGGVGRIDDAGKAIDIEHPQVADAEGGSAVLFVAQCSGVCAGNQVPAGRSNLHQALGLATVYAGDNQSGLQSYRDTYVDVRVHLKMIALEEGVELGVLLQRHGAGFDYEVVYGNSAFGSAAKKAFSRSPVIAT